MDVRMSRAVVAVAVAVAVFAGAPPALAAPEGPPPQGCHSVRRLEFGENAFGTFVAGLNVRVCDDPDDNVDALVRIFRYDPVTGDRDEVATGEGIAVYYCQGDEEVRWFYGPGPRLEVRCE